MSTSSLTQRLQRIVDTVDAAALAENRIGLEKEGLRVASDGTLSQRGHPEALGSALRHPQITTDFAEALLELVTPPQCGVEAVLARLRDISWYVLQYLEGETIFAASMPPVLEEKTIRIADYGSSNIGRLKQIYRRGLAHRYGKMMQTIAGVHFNFSFAPRFIAACAELHTDCLDTTANDRVYFALIRNYRRLSWLVTYLFGASPALDRSFAPQHPDFLLAHRAQTLYAPWACSLRMSRIGYSNAQQSQIRLCHNSLEEYLDDLGDAVSTPWQRYREIGVKVDGDYRQLSDAWLQIENEHYASIRPKVIVPSGKRPLNTLRAQGTAYVELRNLDLHPFAPLGSDAAQLYFLRTLIYYCAIAESPNITRHECKDLENNARYACCYGLSPTLKLHCGEQMRPLTAWAEEVFDAMYPVAVWLDAAASTSAHVQALENQRSKIANPEHTPAMQLLIAMEQRQCEYQQLILQLSQQHRKQILQTVPDEKTVQHLRDIAKMSIAEQGQLEQRPEPPFDDFLAAYLADV